MRTLSSSSTPFGVTIFRALAMIAVASARLAGLTGSCPRADAVRSTAERGNRMVINLMKFIILLRNPIVSLLDVFRANPHEHVVVEVPESAWAPAEGMTTHNP